MSTPLGGKAESSVSAVLATASQKLAGKTTQSVPSSSGHSAKNRPPVTAGSCIASFLALPPTAPLLNDPPRSSADLSSLLVASSSTGSASTDESMQAPQGASLAAAAQLPTPELSTDPNRSSFDKLGAGLTGDSDDASVATPLSLQPEATSSAAESAASNPQDQVGLNVLSTLLTGTPSSPLVQSADQPAPPVGSLANLGLQTEQAESGVAAQAGHAALHAISTLADLVATAPQAQAATANSNISSTQGESTTESQGYFQTDQTQSAGDQTCQPANRGNAASAGAVFAMSRNGSLKQAVAKQPSLETPSNATKQTRPLEQILLSALQSPENKAIARRVALEAIQTPAPSAEGVPDAQPDHPIFNPSVLPPTTTVTSGNSSRQPSSNISQHDLAQSTGAGPVEPPVSVQIGTAASTAAIGSQAVLPGGFSPDPQSRAALSVNSPAIAPAMSVQPAAIGAAGTATPSLASQQTPGSSQKSNSSGAPGCADLPSNMAAPRESPGAGPVQMAQIVSRAAQSEMRIGLTTSAFWQRGSRTIVHANEVGVLIGSEKGDLRSLLSNELPGIANTLQQQNLRLNQVNFHQQGFAFSSQTSSGNGSQERFFTSRPNSTSTQPWRESTVESNEPAEPASSANVRSLSILA